MASSSSAKADYEKEKAFEDICSFGSFSKKDTFTVYKTIGDRFATKEWENMRRSLEHLNIVKFHYSYSERSCLRRVVASGDLSQEDIYLRSYVLESLDFAGRTVATLAQQRADNLREFNIWRRLASLSSALTYLHSHPKAPLFVDDLSPHTVVQVYPTEEGRKARQGVWKMLLLRACPGSSLAWREVVLGKCSN